MADVRSHYSNVTLNGNWYEDRLDVSRLGKDPRLLRTNNVSEAPIKMSRPVDRPNVTIAMESYRIPGRQRKDIAVQQINKDTVSYVYNKQPAENLPRHGPDRDLRELKCTSHVSYGGPYASNSGRRPPRSAPQLIASGNDMLAAGVPTFKHVKPQRHGPWESRAIAEKLHVNAMGMPVDPKDDNFCQSSWRYNRHGNAVYGRDWTDTTDPQNNLPGLGFRDLGIDRPTVRRANLARPNDALNDRTGIWSG